MSKQQISIKSKCTIKSTTQTQTTHTSMVETQTQRCEKRTEIVCEIVDDEPHEGEVSQDDVWLAHADHDVRLTRLVPLAYLYLILNYMHFLKC